MLFFFHADDGIRDWSVTGVQTCALPISVVQTADGQLKLLVAEGISEPGPILEIGNTNSRYRFPMGAREFMNAWNAEGPAHHCAIGIGHISSKLSKLGQLLGMECTVIRSS